MPANCGKPVVDKARRHGVAGDGPTDIQRAHGKYRHSDARFVHRRQSLGQVVLIHGHRHDVAAAVKERLAARIIDELEVGAALDDFGETARGIDMGVNVDHLLNGHRDLLIKLAYELYPVASQSFMSCKM